MSISRHHRLGDHILYFSTYSPEKKHVQTQTQSYIYLSWVEFLSLCLILLVDSLYFIKNI